MESGTPERDEPAAPGEELPLGRPSRERRDPTMQVGSGEIEPFEDSGLHQPRDLTSDAQSAEERTATSTSDFDWLDAVETEQPPRSPMKGRRDLDATEQIRLDLPKTRVSPRPNRDDTPQTAHPVDRASRRQRKRSAVAIALAMAVVIIAGSIAYRWVEMSHARQERERRVQERIEQLRDSP